MICFVVVKLKDVLEQGKSYSWIRPKLCPHCRQSHVWGHGFVLAYFDGFLEGIYLRRWRCPECGCVIRMKPTGYFNRFLASTEAIRRDLSSYIETGKWPSGHSDTRRDHWMKALTQNIRLYLGNQFVFDLITGFDILVGQGRIPVSRGKII